MKDRFSIIKINGFTGIFITVFLLCCVVEGIIVFPSWTLMHIWNFIASHVDNMPTMTLLHGGILWAIVALSTFAILKDKNPISYGTPTVISDEEIRKAIEHAKSIEKLNAMMKEEKSENEIKH